LFSRRHSMIYGHSSNSICYASGARIVAVIIVAVSLVGTQVQAQISGFGRSTAPVFGGTGGMPPPPANPFSTVKGNFPPMHTTVSGQPCISVHARAVAQVADPHIFNHIVLVDNVCGQTIKVQVCYFQSTSCITVAVNGYQKLDRTLGISPGSRDFRYEYRELL
jgi:hypothetical protein